MTITLKESKLTIFGVYVVNNGAIVNKKTEFFEQLHRERSSIGRSREIIIQYADLNGRTTAGENATNDNGP